MLKIDGNSISYKSANGQFKKDFNPHRSEMC